MTHWIIKNATGEFEQSNRRNVALEMFPVAQHNFLVFQLHESITKTRYEWHALGSLIV